MRSRAPALALVLLAGCERRAAPEAVPAPWDGAAAIAPDPFRALVTTAIADAVTPERLVPFPGLPLLLVPDPGSDTVHVLDARYRHHGLRWCIAVGAWPHLDDGQDRQGDCREGEAEYRPGEIKPPGGLRAIAADPAGKAVWIVSGNGDLLRATTDLLGENPLDLLRPARVAALEGFAAGTGTGPAVVGPDGSLWAALDGKLWRWSTDDGALIEAQTPESAVADLVVSGASTWFAIGDTVRAGGTAVTLAGSPARLIPDGEGGVFASVPDLDVVARVGADGTFATHATIPGLTGPLARDAMSGKLYVAVEDGVAVLLDGVEIARHAGSAPLDLSANASAEIAALSADGVVAAHGDEEAIAARDGAPLHVMVAAFFENPRRSDQAVRCEGEGQTLDGYLEIAGRNHAWLDDVPAAIAMGVTPMVARTVTECGREADFSPLLGGTEPGVLFHEAPDCDGDQACLETDLVAEAGDLADWGPTWASGAGSWDLEGEDWVHGVAAAGFDRFLFFGLSALPEIPHEDPRAKDPWPWETEAPMRAWRPASAAAVTTDDPAGPLVLYPGNNVPGFLLGACANLPVLACEQLGAGGGAVFDGEDVASLDLLLHRALAWRSSEGPDTWYFHLPAIEYYDYTEGCTEDARTWSGDGCEAAMVQAWLLDVHRRWVLPGHATWTLPSELPLP